MIITYKSFYTHNSVLKYYFQSSQSDIYTNLMYVFMYVISNEGKLQSAQALLSIEALSTNNLLV